VGQQLQPDLARRAGAGLQGTGQPACRVRVDLPLASLSAAATRQEGVLYRIDQRLGPIGFAIDHFGLVTCEGQLERYTCTVALRRADPVGVGIDLALDATSIALSQTEALEMLQAVSRFDLAAHPAIRFRSSAVAPLGPDRYEVRGLLEIRGVTRLQTFDCVLTDRKADPITGTEVACFQATGCLKASAFGVAQGAAFMSDTMELRIRARIELEA
jgi:polyisoprenoid-binding protein YceI